MVATSATAARHAVAADLDGDGDLDLVSATFTNDTISWYPNLGGQFSTRATDVAQRIVANNQKEDMLAVEVTHLGRVGDTALELAMLEIQLQDGMGAALTSSQASSLFNAARLYRDDGSGSFEPGVDPFVGQLLSFSLAFGGLEQIPFFSGSSSEVSAAASQLFFVSLEMEGDADQQSPSAFRVNHRSLVDQADDADHGGALVLEQGDLAGTGVIDTALSSASCQAPFDLNLVDRVVSTVLVCEAGTRLRFGPSSSVTGSGDLTLRAGSSVVFEPGTMISGALRAEIVPSLLPPPG